MKRFCILGLFCFAGAVALWYGIGIVTQDLPGERMSSVPQSETARRMKAEIVDTYKIATNLLPPEADKLFVNVILKYIPPGTTFDEGEKLLRDVGFSVYYVDRQYSPKQKEQQLHDETRARLHLLTAWHRLAATSLHVTLIPEKPGSFNRIGSVKAQLHTLMP
jgi:hypothetical protein